MLIRPPDWEKLYRSTVYSVSHDLGATIRHVRSFSELLIEKNSGLDDDSKKWLGHIHQAGLQSQRMLDGLLKLSRVYSQSARLSVIGLETLAAHFQCETDSLRSDVFICGNLTRLQVAVQELINNAQTFGQFKGCQLNLEAKTVSLTILDDGIGIAAADWQDSLEPFHRHGQRLTPDHVGMGLPIALAIVSEMHGTLKNSTAGVSIELPTL